MMGIEMGGFAERRYTVSRVSDQSKPAIDPRRAGNSSLRPSTIGQAGNRCSQAHFEDIRHAPTNLLLPGPMEAVLLSLKWPFPERREPAVPFARCPKKK